MTDREKVIKGLECCMWTDERLLTDCKNCPYSNGRGCCNGLRGLHMDALALLNLLKAQEPRAMMLDEVKDGESYWLIAGKEFVIRPVICVHREDDARKPYITFAWQYGTIQLETEDYDKTWRCWTSRPTDEQRKATQWGERYHLSCPSCGKDWWGVNPFPLYCPYCKTNIERR